jgi:hypothetical protein
MTYEAGNTVQADNFRWMHGYSSEGGLDTAILHDQAVDGTPYATHFYGYDTWSRLFSDGYGFFSRVLGFAEVHAALTDGDDRVRFYDDPARVDHLVVSPSGEADFYNDSRRIDVDAFLYVWATTSQDNVDDEHVDPAYSDRVILDGNWAEA